MIYSTQPHEVSWCKSIPRFLVNLRPPGSPSFWKLILLFTKWAADERRTATDVVLDKWLSGVRRYFGLIYVLGSFPQRSSDFGCGKRDGIRYYLRTVVWKITGGRHVNKTCDWLRKLLKIKLFNCISRTEVWSPLRLESSFTLEKKSATLICSHLQFEIIFSLALHLNFESSSLSFYYYKLIFISKKSVIPICNIFLL